MTEQRKGNPLGRLFSNNWQYIAAFFIPAGILFIAYACFGVYPFNNNSVLSLDLNAQYVYYYDYFYDVLNGSESLFYSWSRNFSGEFMGIIGYYLASPFSLIVWLFPREFITEGLLCMMLSKVGAIGVTASIFLYRGRKYSKGTSIIFSIMYALCSYVMVQTMNPMWLDGVMALPLVLYGLESLVNSSRFKLLTLSLVYSFVTCFYIGYMVGIFAAVYFFFYVFMSDIYRRLYTGQLLARLGLFIISSVTAILSSAFMLMPVVNSLTLGKFAFTEPDYSIEQNFTLFNLAGKFLPNSYDTVRMEGLPFFYCGTLTVILACCYFFLKKVTVRKRIASAFLLLSLAAFMYIRPVDMLWHGGQMPNWLPYRYSFIVSLLLVVFAAETFERIKFISKREIAVAGLCIFAVILLLGSMDNYVSVLERDVLPELTTIAPAAAITAILTAVIVQNRDRLFQKKSAVVFIAVLVCGEAFYNTMTALVSQHNDITYSTRDSYLSVITPMREAVNEIRAADTGFYRMEKNFNRSANDPLALGMYGLTHSSSTLNDKPIKFIGELGMTSRGHYTKYYGATPLVDDLLGIKYILSCPNDEAGRITAKEDISVEQNLDAMPIAYLTDPLLAEFSFEYFPADADNVFQKQNRLLSHMLGESNANPYIKTIPLENLMLETENVTEGTAGGHTAYTVVQSGKNAQLKYTVTALADGEIFLWMPSDFERKLNVWLNYDVWKGNYYETENYNAKSLGCFKEGEEFTVTLTLTTDKLYFKDIMFGYFDSELYESDYGRLRAMNESTIVSKISPTYIIADTDYPEERLFFTTIPKEPGWKILVDGTESEQETIAGTFTGVMLSAGAHKIEMKYSVPGGRTALILTGSGVLLFLLMCVLDSQIRRRYGNKTDVEDLSDVLEGDLNLLSLQDDDVVEYNPKKAEEHIDDILGDLNQINEIEPIDNVDEGEDLINEQITEQGISGITRAKVIEEEAAQTDMFDDEADNRIVDIAEESDNQAAEAAEEADDQTVGAAEEIESKIEAIEQEIDASQNEEGKENSIVENTYETERGSVAIEDDSESDEKDFGSQEMTANEKPEKRTGETTFIPYMEVSKPVMVQDRKYSESADDFFPQDEIDRLNDKKNKSEE